MSTRVMNQLHVVLLNEGLRGKKPLWVQPSRGTGGEVLRLSEPPTKGLPDLLDQRSWLDADRSTN